MTGYDYGNARLRARKPELFALADYHRLAGAGSVDALLGMLSATRYRTDVETAMTRRRAIGRLDGAVAHHLGRTLRELGDFYQDEPGVAVALLLERWDLRNLRSVLRGVAARASPEAIIAALVPVGTISPGLLRTLAGATGVRSLLDTLLTLGVPDASTAAALLEAWPSVEATQESAPLEAALHAAYSMRWQSTLGELGLPTLDRLFGREADRTNLLVAVRARPSDGGPAATDLTWMLGTISARALNAAVQQATAEAFAAAVVDVTPSRWVPLVTDWTVHRDPARLAVGLDEAVTAEMAGLFVTGDPLSIDVPVAYLASKENEAQNLRFVARGVAAGLPAPTVVEHLVTPW